MPFIVKDCVRCGVKNIQMIVVGQISHEPNEWEVSAACTDCKQLSIWLWRSRSGAEPMKIGGNLEKTDYPADVRGPVRIATVAVDLSEHIPARIADLFREANECRQMTWYEAAGAIYRKTVDVATKHIYATDQRLADKKPADALRVRIKSLGEMKILEADIVELADVAALDGNDAAHDVDPYTAEEAEALEDITMDLLDRLFVRPARFAAVKAKQIASGQRKPD
ncbi:hypothetical protein JP75_11525 [Devosia riboflavina]|uniref:DUF4145 domain-containing protein n=1 Tax=Devosia riboflavina TaxID=46914 RepID=A0A087M274_9HYPH|nr:DUF4145 domain-containing protein [Devosia riboflavina]KFL30977.1 hypothetical protein JP75_11525 [Devosia riboflavina]